jgi:hypothetical protein
MKVDKGNEEVGVRNLSEENIIWQCIWQEYTILDNSAVVCSHAMVY